MPDLLSILERTTTNKGHTSRELAKLSGTSLSQVQRILKNLHEAGRLEVGRKVVENICGVKRKEYCYWLKEGK